MKTNYYSIGSFQTISRPPPWRKLEVIPPTPIGCPDTLVYYYYQKILPWGSVTVNA